MARSDGWCRDTDWEVGVGRSEWGRGTESERGVGKGGDEYPWIARKWY